VGPVGGRSPGVDHRIHPADLMPTTPMTTLASLAARL
jgi:hypothetical protein